MNSLVINSANSFQDSLNGAPGVNLTIQGLMGIIVGVACWLTRIAIVFIVIALIVYGIQFLISRGDSGRFTKAKDSFKYGLWGIVVILGAYTIIATVAYAIDPTTPFAAFRLDCPAF